MQNEAHCVITRRCGSQWPALIRQMHADRKKVFVDLLRWRIPHSDDLEQDGFDNDDAEYLILREPGSGDHVASLRLLPTTAPHLMTEVFPTLCSKGPPRGTDVREITRFCVAPRGCASERRLARNRIVRAMVEYGLMAGVGSFTAACDMGFLSEVLSAGWDCRPLGPPQLIDGRPVGALHIHIGPATLAMLRDTWTSDPVPLVGMETVAKWAA